jgi:phosphoribosyl 1,2-cyclic phosphodiesterase
VSKALKSRLLKSHFSLENVKQFLRANDLSRVREIWLLHLSDGNSDAERFKREVMELTGKPTYIA